MVWKFPLVLHLRCGSSTGACCCPWTPRRFEAFVWTRLASRFVKICAPPALPPAVEGPRARPFEIPRLAGDSVPLRPSEIQRLTLGGRRYVKICAPACTAMRRGGGRG